MSHLQLNKFISFEGMDGCGKSTVINAVKEVLEKKGHKVVLTREPGGATLSEELRDMLKNKDMSLSTEIALFTGARLEHLHKTILPAIAEGAFVLCDRYIDSTFVYQIKAVEDKRLEEERCFYGPENYISLEMIRERLYKNTVSMLSNFNIPLPEKTFFLDVSVEESLARRGKRGEALDKFEQKSFNDLTKIRNSYLSLMESSELLPERFVKVDANLSPEKVKEQVLASMKEFYSINLKKKEKTTLNVL